MKTGSKLMIANFIRDEKAIDAMIDNQSLTNDIVDHQYILVSDKQDFSLRYIKKSEKIRIVKSKDVKSYLYENNIDAIFLHGLYSLPLHLYRYISNTIPVFWFAWGWDLYASHYHYGLISRELYGEHTKRLFSKFLPARIGQDLKTKLGNVYRALYYTDLDYIFNRERLYANAVSRVNYFSGVLQDEYKYIEKGKYGFHAEPVIYKYQSSRQSSNVFSGFSFEKKVDDANNILVGNSATPENNHIELFKLLSQFDLKNRKVIVPLNYGLDWYKKEIVKEGRKYLGTHFFPLTKFLPIKDYSETIDSCCVAVFGHERQQGIGNVALSLRKGLKVFLSESSIAYNRYREMGVVVHSIQSELNASVDLSCESDSIAKQNVLLLSPQITDEAKIRRFLDLYSKIQFFGKQQI